MTVCIAAFADNPRSIVTVSDMALSRGYTSTSVATIKIVPIHKRWRAMMSGKISQALGIVPEIVDKLRDVEMPEKDTVYDAAREAYIDYGKKLASERVLAQYGLDMDSFVKSRSDLGDVLFEKLWADIGRIQVECDLIILGFTADDFPHIFLVSNPTAEHSSFITPCDIPGFACIGSGGYMAESLLHSFEQYGGESVERTVYHACCAKFAAESASDVGKDTYVLVCYPDGSARRIADKAVDTDIRNEWKRYVRPKARVKGVQKVAAKLQSAKVLPPKA